MLKVLRAADIVLIVCLIVCGLAASFYISRTAAQHGRQARITVNGKIFGTYDLSKNRSIELGTGNTAVIEDGNIRMKSADCRGQDCIRQGKISRPSQTIVCLPHKVIIEIEGGDEDEYDSISK